MNDLKIELPFYCGEYVINSYGEILDSFGTKLKTFLVDGELMVELKVLGGFDNFKLATLVAIAFLRIDIPFNLWKRIVPIYNDSNKANVVPSNISYRFDGPLECHKYKGFYYIPFHTQYVINEQGALICLNKSKLVSWYINKPKAGNNKKNITGGYYGASVVKDNGSRGYLSRHRAIGLVFKPYNVNPSTLIINHDNGVPGDDRLDNLEWTTYAKNNQHAYDNGLRPNGTRPVLYRNWKTGEEISFISIEKCAQHVGCKRELIENRLNRKRFSKRYHDGLAFKYDDGTEWPPLEDRVTEVENEAREIIARNIFTGVIHIFESALQASKITGANSGDIIKHANKERIIPIKGFNFRNFPSKPKWPNHSSRHLEIYREYPLRPPVGVIVNNIETNEEMFFTSYENAATYFKISVGQMYTRCKTGRVYDECYKFSIFKLTENLSPAIE